MSAAPLRRRAPAARPAPARRAPVRRPAAPRTVTRPRGAVVLDRLLSGRLWIGLIFLLLVGIVFFNVDLLRMNRDIAVTAEKSETLKRQNARLRGDLARLGSSERIQKVAADSGLVLPAAGEVRYLKPNPAADARNALNALKNGSGTASSEAVPPAEAGGSTGAATQGQTPTTTGQPTASQPEAAQPQAATPQTATPQAATPQTAAPVQQQTTPPATTTPQGQ